MRLTSLVAPVLGVAMMTALVLPSCKNGDDEVDQCRDYTPPASFDPSTPVVSFQNDVVPIFNFSCVFSSCHGSLSGGANGIFLGGADAKAVRKNLVDVSAPELPSMVFVKPGDPRNSYLMRKLDGSQCLLDAQCIDGDCGDSMPQNEQTLPIETRDVVRRWIAQGAQEN
jgi:hypothetical protein